MEKAEEFPRLQPLGAINELPPLPRAAGTSYATGLSYYGEDQMRSYAQAAIAALEAETQRLREVVSKVNDRCDHLGMSLGEIKAERDALRAECEGLRKDAARNLNQVIRAIELQQVADEIIEDGHMHTQDLARLREASAKFDADMEGQEP